MVALFVLEVLLLVTALSLDALTAGFAYGTQKIKVPLPSLLVISLICSGTLTLSLLCGSWVQDALDGGLTRLFCFLLLGAMGGCKLFDSMIKSYIRRNDTILIRFSASSLRIVLNIYADADAADADHSHSLSVRESAYLAAALSLDGMAAGLGASVPGAGVLLAAVLALIMTAGVVRLGGLLGRRLAAAAPLDLSWVGGVLLLLLAVLKL